jgi:MscS family membrane protein
MDDLIGLYQQVAAMPALRALAVLLASIVVAKIVELILCRGLLPLAVRTRTEIDDRLVKLMHMPVFLSVLLIGIYVAVGMLPLEPSALRLATSGIQTLAVLIWVVTRLAPRNTNEDQAFDKRSW